MGAALLNYKREKRKENIYFSWLNASRLKLDERVPGSFMLKIIAAIFDFYKSGRLGIEGNLYQWMGGATIEGKRWESVGLSPSGCVKFTSYPHLGSVVFEWAPPPPSHWLSIFIVPKYQDQLYSNKLAYHQHYEKLVSSNGMN